MLKIQEIIDDKDTSITPEGFQVNLFDEDCRSGSLVFPPLNVVKAEHSKPIVHYEIITDTSNLGADLCQIEINNLLKDMDRFKDSPTYLTRLSSMYALCGDEVQSIQYAKKARELDDSDSLTFELANKFLKYGYKKDAQDLFSGLANNNNISALLKLAEISIANLDMETSKEIVTKALNEDITDWRIHLLAGTIELSEFNCSNAIKHYRIALQEKINSPSIYINMSIAYFLQENNIKAISFAKKALNLNPLNKTALTLLTDISFSSNLEVDSSEKYINKYLRYMPISNTFIERLGKVYLLKDESDKGIALFENNKKFYNDVGMWNNFGVFWSKKNKLIVAAQYFNQAIEKAGGLLKAHKDRASEIAVLNLSRVLYDTKRYNKAIDFINAFLESSPKDYYNDEVLCEIYHVRIRSYLALGENEAVAKYANILASQKNIFIRSKIDACTLLTTHSVLIDDDPQKALKFATMAYDLAKEYSEIDPVRLNTIINNLAFSHLENDDLLTAKSYIDKLVFNLPNKEYAYATRGLYFIKKGDYKKGQEEYLKAISFSQNKERKLLLTQKLNYELGKYWYSNNNNKYALRYLSKSMKHKNITDTWKVNQIYNLASKLIKVIKDNIK